MKIKFKFLSLFLCLIVVFCSFSTVAFAEGENGEAVLGDIDGSGTVDTQDARDILKMASGIIETDLAIADMNGDGIVSIDDATQALIKATNIGGVVIPNKNGDNYLSDDPDNEFIKLIASTYNVDTKALVAIYSVPDSGTNYVLQFKASGLLNKTYEKSPDNLYRVYHIGLAPERTISYTSGNLVTGNFNCSGAEGMLVFNLVQTKVMTQYPDYFEGV
ncbi:MAG: hypothetical protein IJ025_06425 [Clostridia bacterium]|nr:hypothetical protein [Clostridia bacterium]